MASQKFSENSRPAIRPPSSSSARRS
jgi:hypothetical protein